MIKSKQNKSLLVAMALGDGHISKLGAFQLVHCEKQEEYIKYKCNILSKILEVPIHIQKFHNNSRWISWVGNLS